MKRFGLITIALAGLALVAASVPLSATDTAANQAALRGKAAGPLGYNEPLCVSRSSLCTDTYDNPTDEYVGHDEPSVVESNVAGSATQPSTESERPRAGGRWARGTSSSPSDPSGFGLTLGPQPAPEFTKVWRPDSDANDLVGTDPARTS